MITKIFETYSKFLEREDQSVNGVSPEFAADNPKWEEEKNNKGCWNCSRCSGCSRCSDCSDCSHIAWLDKKENLSPDGASKAVSYGIPETPVIPNIHRTVFEAASGNGALKMNDWNTCETTHCRAGWVVHLAGEAGKALEKETSTLFAAMQIYHKSSEIKVSPVRFFDSNEKALENMKECAEKEAE